MCLRYLGNELYNHARHKCSILQFLRGLCWVSIFWILLTHCVPCLGWFLVFILCSCVHSIFDTICCVIVQIYNIVIIIIKRGRQCKVWTDRFTPYQSKDPSHTISTNSEDKKGASSLGQSNSIDTALKTRQSTPSNRRN